MKFYMPVKLYEEDNCVINHGAELAALGKRAIIVTGKCSSKKNGSLEDVKKALDDNGTEYIVFNEIEENPSIETVMQARDEGVCFNADFVIGVGGGSALDASKAVALMIYHKDKGRDYLYKKDCSSSALPIAAVPTTCGTGSEVTPYSILTIHEKRTKASLPHRLFPNLALVDGKYLKTAPKSVICNTAMDSLGHLFESFINSNADDYSRMTVDAGLRLWSRCKDILDGTRESDLTDYKNLMNASSLAGMAISHTSTSLPHGLSYSLTYELGTEHGKAVGYFLAGYLKEADNRDREYVLHTAGFKDIDEFEEFYNKVCGKTKVSDKILDNAMKSVLSNKAKLKNCPYEVNEEVLKRIVMNTQ